MWEKGDIRGRVELNRGINPILEERVPKMGLCNI
jgi:hypothetical protein